MKYKLSKHASEMLDIRFKNWTWEQINNAIEKGAYFLLKGEKHIYLGTGLDTLEDKTEVRPKAKRRHLFIVVKQKTIVTAVFHTHSALLKRLEKAEQANCIVPSKESNLNWVKVANNVWTVINKSKLSIRPDLWWQYTPTDKPVFYIKVKNLY